MGSSYLNFYQRRALDSYLQESRARNSLQIPNDSNGLIKIHPTRIASPFDNDENVSYSSVTSNVSLDNTIYCPASGLAMAKVDITAGVTSAEFIGYDDISIPTMSPDDVWMVSFYLPELVDSLEIVMHAVVGTSFGGQRKTFQISGRQYQKGYNLVPILNVEQVISSSDFGVVGTTPTKRWSVVGGIDPNESNFKSARVSARITSALDNSISVHIGSVFVAPSGWAKAAIMWGADDVPEPYVDLAVPIIESYGWNYTLFVTSTYAADSPSDHTPIEKIQASASKGNEIWGHTRRHENMPNQSAANKIRALVPCAKYFSAQGLAGAAKYMAWPFGAYDDASIQAAKDAGYRLAASIDGMEINPFMANVNPYNLSRFSMERSNSWQADAQLNGACLRGSGVIAYMHRPIPGGSGTNNWPGSGSFYIDHLKRWCDLVAKHESDGRCVVTTPLRYFKMLGIDPATDNFIE